MALYDNGILMTNGFSIGAAKPADLKYLADTITDRDKLITDNISYEGMLVYVKETGKTYQLLSDNTWDEFGFNQDKFIGNLYDGLDSTSSTIALTANQGRVLNTKINSHISDTISHITATERSNWNAKASTSIATSTANGLMSSADKKKLDSIAEDATKYVHPDTHPATMIVEDSTHRFVTDTEKSTWNAKASTDTATVDNNGLMSAADKKKLNSIAEGATVYVHPSSHPATMIVEDTTHRFVTDTEKSTWNAKASTAIATQSANGLMSSTDKTKLDGIASNANNYTHPSSHPATMITSDSTHRFVTDEQITYWNSKPGSTSDLPSATPTTSGLMSAADKAKLDAIEAEANKITIDTALSSTSTNPVANNVINTALSNKASKDLATQTSKGLMSSADKKKLDSIAEDATKYVHPDTHPATMIVEDSTHRFVTDTEKSTWNGKASTSVVTTSANGLMSSTDKTKLDGIEESANKYTHPTYTARSDGLYKITVDATGHVSAATAVTKEDITGLGIPSTNTTYSNMTAATASAAGKAGLVPAPAAGKQTSFLRGDGTWVIPTNTTYSDATQSTHGLMSTVDKTKLDGIEEGANNYTHPTFSAKSSGLYKITVTANGHVSAAIAVTKDDITGLGIPGSDTTYTNATTSKAGLMSSTDKTNLNTAITDIKTMKTQIETLQADYEALLAKVKTGLFF